MTPEGRLMREMQVALSQAGHRLVRVNAGHGWVGPTKRNNDGSVLIKHAQPFVGVPEGVSDLIGCASDGAFVAIEVKTQTGRPTERQTAYIEMVRSIGGRAGVARTVEEALAVAGGHQKGIESSSM